MNTTIRCLVALMLVAGCNPNASVDEDGGSTVDAGAANPDVPGAPTTVRAIAGNAQATVTWGAAPDHGFAISSYTVAASPGPASETVTTGTTATVSGLTNGVAYTFAVFATNTHGNGPLSKASNAVTPSSPMANVTAPGAPTSVTATAGNAQATVTWTPPANDGGSTITGYLVTVQPGGTAMTVSPSPITVVTGLTNGTSYTFTVKAFNTAGVGPASSASNPVTPQAPASNVTVPGAPTSVSATAGDSTAIVSWTAPASDGGSAITSYVITSSPGSIGATAQGDAEMAPVSGLTDGVTYTFTVQAVNAAGTGLPSSASNSVTPQAASTCGNGGASCQASSDCCGALSCSNSVCTAPQCGDSGMACVQTSDCCESLTCSNSECTAPPTCSSTGASCEQSTECCTAMCSGGVCRSPAGGTCATANDCMDDLACTNGACANPPQGPCVNGNDCADGVSCNSDVCCQSSHESCTGDDQCCSGFSCENAACCMVASSFGCASANDCCDGIACSGGQCCQPPQGTCNSNADCCVNTYCGANNQCCVAGGGPCTSNADCCDGVTCNGGVCQSEPGEACGTTSANECDPSDSYCNGPVCAACGSLLNGCGTGWGPCCGQLECETQPATIGPANPNPPYPTLCCLPTGASCTSGSQCCSSNCDELGSHTCRCNEAENSPGCTTDDQCCTGRCTMNGALGTCDN